MFASILAKIKNFGVGHAIDALDNLEGPLATKLDIERQKLLDFNSQELSKYLIDIVQNWLRAYFNIPQPLPKNDSSLPNT